MSHGISSNAIALPTFRESLTRLRYLGSFLRPHRRQFTLSIITAIFSTSAAAVIPFLFKHAIDEGIIQSNMHDVRLYVSLAIAVGVLDWVVLTLNIYWSFWSVRVVNDLRTALFEHVNKQGMSFFNDMRTGTVISRLTNDIDALEQLVSDGVFMVFVNMLLLGLIEGFLFTLDWRLALATNIIFPIMLAATMAFRYYSSRAYRRTRERMAMVTAYLAESLSGMRVVQSFAAEDRAAAEFDRTNEHYRQANLETIWLSALYFPGVELLSAVGTSIVLWYGGFLSERDMVSVGVIFAFIAYLDNFFDPIQQLSQFYGAFLSAMAALDKIMLVMETTPSIVDAPDARILENLRGDVAFNHVTFSYKPGGTEVLHDIDVQVAAGSTVALVGHTGAGKSTVVKLLSRFYDPQQGAITLDGVDIRELQQTWLRRTMGIVPQEGFLFAGTIRDNISYGRPDASLAEVITAAETVGASDFIGELEDEYNTHVGERGSRLSAGERQLVAFARALLADPRLLVLDEATSSVDVATEQRLAAGLRALVDGRTAFIVAHRLSTIRDADLIVVVNDGRIVERGSHDELLAMHGAYAGLYGSWTGSPPTIEERLSST